MENEKNIKAENFKRLAEARTDKVLSMLDLIGNLSNKCFYDYTDDQIKAIFDEIQKCLDENKEKFSKKKKKAKRRFTL